MCARNGSSASCCSTAECQSHSWQRINDDIRAFTAAYVSTHAVSKARVKYLELEDLEGGQVP